EFPSKVTRPPFSVLDKTKIKTTFGIEIPHWRDSMLYCLQRLAKQQ
ncbi:MAG: sugar nucleotide-binding protein, partial [Alistipes sp.]|nr:sugar nucleotide-binding protein [Alistipes sp.]